MGANLAFSLTAAAGSLLICIASAVKGRWAVAIVFGMLVVGFLARALEGRRDKPRRPPEEPAAKGLDSRSPQGPAHSEPRIKATRFKRR